MITASECAELLDDEDLSPLQRAMFESELRIATNRERRAARISEEAKEAAKIHRWQQDTMRVMVDLLALQLEVRAWESRKHKPYCYDGARARLQHKQAGWRERLAKARREAAEGNVQQVDWQLDHAELIAAVGGDA